jgi:hypothetical protein
MSNDLKLSSTQAMTTAAETTARERERLRKSERERRIKAEQMLAQYLGLSQAQKVVFDTETVLTD